MLENVLNGQFDKSAALWHYLVPRVVAKNNSQLSCKYLCWYTLLFFLRFPYVFINFHEYANLIISILYRWLKLLCLTFLSSKYFRMSSAEI